MKRIIFVLAIFVIAFAGCIGGGPSTEELKLMMVDPVKDMSSYRFTMDMEQEVEIFDLSVANESNSMKMTSRSVGAGDVNLTDKSMKMSISSVTSSDDMEDVTTDMEMYFISDTIYMTFDGNWTQLKIPLPEEMWDKQNQVKIQIELLNESAIELIGSEKINGTDCYKLKVVPDMDTYSKIFEEQFGSTPPVGVNLTALYENMEMKWDVWLAKDTHLPMKYQIYVNYIITPDMIEQQNNETKPFKMDAMLGATMNFYDFNQPIIVELPEEAKSAPPLSLFPIQVASPEES